VLSAATLCLVRDVRAVRGQNLCGLRYYFTVRNTAAGFARSPTHSQSKSDLHCDTRIGARRGVRRSPVSV